MFDVNKNVYIFRLIKLVYLPRVKIHN